MWVNQLTFSDQKADYSCITAYLDTMRPRQPDIHHYRKQLEVVAPPQALSTSQSGDPSAWNLWV